MAIGLELCPAWHVVVNSSYKKPKEKDKEEMDLDSHNDTLTLEDIEQALECIKGLSPRIAPFMGRYFAGDTGEIVHPGENIGPVALLHPGWGLTIALIHKNGGIAAFMHPDHYCDMANIPREELDRRIESEEMPTIVDIE